MEASNLGQSSGGSESDRGGSDSMEIKIKTLDAQTYTMRVDRHMSIIALKEQVASLVGVAVPNQRLICRGKVLKDDQLLSSYNVEDGHTLHLVARPPQQPTAIPTTTGPSDGAMASSQNRGGHVSHSVLMGTINIPDSGEGAMPDLNRIISAVLSSVGLGSGISGSIGGNVGGGVSAGVMPIRGHQSAASEEQARVDGTLQAAGNLQLEHALPRDLELQFDALYGPPPDGGAGTTGHPLRFPQPMVIPDALTTMSQYLDRLEQGFAANEAITALTAGRNDPGQVVNTARNREVGPGSSAPGLQPAGGSSSTSGLAQQPQASLGPHPSGDPQEPTTIRGENSLSRRLPTPAALGALVRRVQGLLHGGADTALSRLAGQLESEPSLNNPGARAEVQASALRDGSMMQQLGALLLELGRTTQTLRMGQSPAESVVNAGPAVFISPLGPNPMMIQPLLPTGGLLGAVPVGIPQTNGGIPFPSLGASLGPRSIDIHIHTSDLGLESPSSSPSPSPSPSSQQQPASRTLVGITSGAPSLTMRHLLERAEAANGGQQGSGGVNSTVQPPGRDENLTTRQLVERAEADHWAQPGNEDQAASGGLVQGAIMTFDDNGAVRWVPVRLRPVGSGNQRTSVSGALHTRLAAESGGLVTNNPFVARLLDQGTLAPLRTPPSVPATVAGGTQPEMAAAGQQGHSTTSGQPTFRAQIHVQGLGGQSGNITDGISFSLGPSSGEFRVQQVPSHQGQGSNGVSQDASAGNRASGAGAAPTSQPSDGGAIRRDPAGAPTPGGIDVATFISSVGPFLQQIAEAFQQSRSTPREQTGQLNEQQPGRNQPARNEPNSASDALNLRDSSAQPEFQAHREQNGAGGSCDEQRIGQGQASNSKETVEKMEVDGEPMNANALILPSSSGIQSTLPMSVATPTAQQLQDEPAQTQGVQQEENTDVPKPGEGHAPPVGLGLGVLQPLPARPRRRQGQRQRQMENPSVSVGRPLVRSACSVVHDGSQNFGLQPYQSVTRPDNQSASEQSVRLLAGLPGGNQRDGQNGPGVGEMGLTGGNQRDGQNGLGVGDMGGMISELLMSNPAMNSIFRPAGGTDDQASARLGGLVSQLVRSPLIENIVHQVMESMGDGEPQNLDDTLSQRSRQNHGGQGGLDLSGMLQQVIPVVSQMLVTGRNSAGTRQAPAAGSGTGGELGVQGGEIRRETERWKDSLNEEELATWTETMTADVNHQQSMAPQRPFSDVYARGSPVAKRQKTDLEGAAQKLESGDPPEEILTSMTENAIALSMANEAANGLETSELAEHIVRSEGLVEAYMAVLSHDLAARVAADPDFGDGSRFPNAVRVLQQSEASKKPAGER